MGAVLGLLLALAEPTAAQAPVVLVAHDPAVGFLSRFTLVTSVEALGEGHRQYRWDADFGVGVDVVDFGRGRVQVAFNYESVLGDEYQPFDPRQGNYTIETLGTLRWRPVEVGLLLHHVSRHLGDRAKRFGIAWNDVGLRIGHAGGRRAWAWQMNGVLVRTVSLGFVDYSGDLGGDVVVHRRLNSRVSLLAAAAAHRRSVRESVRHRGAQAGGRAEVGVRVRGEAGSMEVVVGIERRVDADALELVPREWAFAGLRFVLR